jgi:diguanylate cyclase (GGDEF)-like protein
VTGWLPLRRRVTATVSLTLLLALLFGIGALLMAHNSVQQTDALVGLADASKSVRGLRTRVDAMQFAAHRFVASNHRSAARQLDQLYAETRTELDQCLRQHCAGVAAHARLERLSIHLDRFYQAFQEAVAQRGQLERMINGLFEPSLGRALGAVEALQQTPLGELDQVNLKAIGRHLIDLEGAIDALMGSSNLHFYDIISGDFHCEHGHLDRLSAQLPQPEITAIRTELLAMEDGWGLLAQHIRGYLFLVDVVMAADAHEIKVIADQLEQQIDAELLAAHAQADSKLKRMTLLLLLLLLAGSLVVLGVGRVMANSVTHQLRQLTRVFNELAAGSRAPLHIDTRHQDEIDELGRAALRFREANIEIADLLGRYQALNEELESKVAERTLALEQSNRQLEQLANTDRLTGLLNRRALEQRLVEEVKRSRRYGRPLALLFLDLDHFKVINDRFGHEVGDQVLVRLTKELTSMLRANDRLGRWGGEEFLLLCSETDGAAARRLAERIRTLVEGLQIEPVGQITVSIGIASLLSGQTPESLIACADQAMYRAKSLGRNRSVVAPNCV